MTKIKQLFQNKKSVVTIVICIVAFVFVLLFTPLFSVKNINVVGNEKVDPATIINMSGITLGENIFKTDFAQVENKVSKVAYVDNVKAKMKFPDTVVISVTEAQPSAYINFIGSYIAISEKGKILDIKQNFNEIDRPVVYGVKVDKFEIGTQIVADDEQRVGLLYEMLKQLNLSGIIQKIQYLDISDTDNITMTLTNKISVKLGDTEGIKYKISYLKSVLDTLKEESGGVIDLRDTKNVIYDASWLNFWVICINICQIHEQNVKKLKKYWKYQKICDILKKS